MNQTTATEENRTTEAPHIVCADDDHDIRQLLAFNLESEGYEVTTCADGMECWKLLTGIEAPDLLVLDVMMPGHDGFEILNKVRESDRLDNIPIIMLTSRCREKDVVTGFDAGVNHYIEKPFSPRELMARIRRVLE